MDVDIYHDESKENGYWHGILVVPRESRPALLQSLADARRHTQFNFPIGVKGMKPGKTGKLNCLKAFVSIGVASMIRHGDAEYITGERFFDGTTMRTQYAQMKPLNVKFAALRCAQNFENLALKDYKKGVETTLRIGIKGLLHYASTVPGFEPLCIRSLHMDGHEHYTGRLDEMRILGRLQGELRSGITIADDARILDASGNHLRKGCAAYDDCQLLQMTDTLIGSLRIGLTAPQHLVHRERCTIPVLRVYERALEGWARMKNSRWGMNFSASAMNVPNGEITFEPIVADTPGVSQTSLF